MRSVDVQFNIVLMIGAEGFLIVTSGRVSVASLILRRSGHWVFFLLNLMLW